MYQYITGNKSRRAMLTASSSFPLAFRQDSARELFTASESGETVHWNTPLTSLACKSLKDGFDMDNMCGSSCADCFKLFQILIVWAPTNWKSYILATELVRRFLHLHLSWPPGLTFWSGGWLGRSRRIQTVSSLQESRCRTARLVRIYIYIYTLIAPKNIYEYLYIYI